jgi:hypothetical protein
LLSPGIPEYISSSSRFNAIVLNPALFVLQLLLNLGLYGPGVILIREATIRWKKGWATVLLLGAAYGILEEGIALSTLYNPLAGPVSKLGYYGHYLGVNWIWLSAILPVHMIFSISLPILLLGLALPETNGKSLVISRKGIASAFVILGIDVSILFLLILLGEHYWMGWPIFVSSFATIGLLILLAKHVPTGLLHARTNTPKISPLRIGIVGALFYTSVLLVEQLGIGTGAPALADLVFVIAIEALFLIYVQNTIGHEKNARQLIALAAGLTLPIAAIGLIAEIRLPLVLVVDFAFGIFIWKLLRNERISAEAPTTDLKGRGC